jgi:tetratricopeptide (TPR) repeat protein
MQADVFKPPMPARQSQVLALLGHFYLKQGFGQRAMAVFSALEILDPNTIAHVRANALACRRAGRLEQSLACLDRLALRGRINAPYHLLRAQVLQGLARPQEAEQSMRAYMQARALEHPSEDLAA